MKVVFDTNVLVVALLKKGKAYRLLQHGLRNDGFDILSTPEQLAELTGGAKCAIVRFS